MKFLIEAELSKSSGIYVMSNSLDNRVYIGATRNFYTRFKSHRAELLRGIHHCKTLQLLVAESGIDCLQFRLAESLVNNPLTLRELEEKWFKHYANDSSFAVLNSTLTSGIQPISAGSINEFDTVTAKVYKDSRTDLRIIAAMTGETQQQVVDRLVTNEAKRLNLPLE